MNVQLNPLFDPKNPIEMFDWYVPTEFTEDTVRCLVTSSHNAFDRCKKRFPAKAAHDLRPHERRARFDSEWYQTAEQRDDMTPTWAPNAANNSFHARITCGRVIMTASVVTNPFEIVRNAVFRETYAREAQMLLSFVGEESHDDPPSDQDALYAILIYGPSNQRTPSFADIVFPNSDVSKYLARIRLYDRHRDVVDSLVSFQEEVIADDFSPRLRRGNEMPGKENTA